MLSSSDSDASSSLFFSVLFFDFLVERGFNFSSLSFALVLILTFRSSVSFSVQVVIVSSFFISIFPFLVTSFISTSDSMFLSYSLTTSFFFLSLFCFFLRGGLSWSLTVIFTLCCSSLLRPKFNLYLTYQRVP